MAIFFVSWPKAQDLPSLTKRTWKEFDYTGSLLIIGASVLVVFAFQNAGEVSGPTWAAAVFIAPLTVGLILWICLVAWGYMAVRFYPNRFALTFPIALFRNRAYAAAAISTLFLGYPYFTLNYAFPLWVQVVEGKSALLGGLMLLPMLGSVAIASILTGFINRAKNYFFETMLLGACFMTLGVGLLTTVHGRGDDAKALGFLVFSGLGFGFSVAAATMLTSVEMPIADFGQF